MRRPERQIPQQAPREPVALDDLQMIEKAKRSKGGAKFSALWRGDASGYKSPSEADQALCNILAFWTNRNPNRMDRLFRQSGLMRKKWDRRQSGSTYGALTIQNAISDARSGYDPRDFSRRRTERDMLWHPLFSGSASFFSDHPTCTGRSNSCLWLGIGSPPPLRV